VALSGTTTKTDDKREIGRGTEKEIGTAETADQMRTDVEMIEGSFEIPNNFEEE
jgi:hypothetical protein